MARKQPPPHPAVFSTSVAAVMRGKLQALELPLHGLVLDPFAGVGYSLGVICESLGLTPIGIEIESGYFRLGATHPCVIQGDSRKLPYLDNHFDAAITSPAYPNGVSDNFVAQDNSTRHTYVHRLRSHLGADYTLAEGNTAGMNPRRSPKALEAFYDVHRAVWAEVYRVLKPGATFLVNTKDTTAVPFKMHTQEQLEEAGFIIKDTIQVDVPGLNHGKNHENKLSHEDITVAVKP